VTAITKSIRLSDRARSVERRRNAFSRRPAMAEDESVEGAFLRDMLILEGKDVPNRLRHGALYHFEGYEQRAREAEVDERKKDQAAQLCRDRFRARLVAERDRCKGTSIADHLQMVIDAIDGRSA
jgi:hypothetical protein